MITAAYFCSSIMMAIATFMGVRKNHRVALLLFVLAAVPLFLTSTMAKAVFTWLGLIGPIAIATIVVQASRTNHR